MQSHYSPVARAPYSTTSVYLGCFNRCSNRSSSCFISRSSRRRILATGLLAASSVLVAVPLAGAVEATQEADTLANIPQTLSGECASAKDCKKARIQHPKSRRAESCTVKCVNTCIRGGDGSPGEGPLNIRRPLVVFKQGFRSR